MELSVKELIDQRNSLLARRNAILGELARIEREITLHRERLATIEDQLASATSTRRQAA